jgi:hypothetical protein
MRRIATENYFENFVSLVGKELRTENDDRPWTIDDCYDERRTMNALRPTNSSITCVICGRFLLRRNNFTDDEGGVDDGEYWSVPKVRPFKRQQEKGDGRLLRRMKNETPIKI